MASSAGNSKIVNEGVVEIPSNLIQKLDKVIHNLPSGVVKIINPAVTDNGYTCEVCAEWFSTSEQRDCHDLVKPFGCKNPDHKKCHMYEGYCEERISGLIGTCGNHVVLKPASAMVRKGLEIQASRR